MKSMTVTIKGNSPILMHSDRLANPLDPLKKELSTYTGKRKKTDEDHIEISRLEWKAAMYYDEKMGPFIPGAMLKATILGAAKKTKEGPKVRSGLIVAEDKNKLEYSGTRNQDKMWDAGTFTDIRSVVVQRARLMRCRPIFSDWETTFEVFFDDSELNPEDIERFIEIAGRLVGVGDYRPACGGNFGRFEISEVKHA